MMVLYTGAGSIVDGLVLNKLEDKKQIGKV